MGFGTCYQRHMALVNLQGKRLCEQWALERATRGTMNVKTYPVEHKARTMGFGTCYQRHTFTESVTGFTSDSYNVLCNVLPEALRIRDRTCLRMGGGQWALERATRGT